MGAEKSKLDRRKFVADPELGLLSAEDMQMAQFMLPGPNAVRFSQGLGLPWLLPLLFVACTAGLAVGRGPCPLLRGGPSALCLRVLFLKQTGRGCAGRMLTHSSAQPDQFLAGAFANRDNEHDPALKFLHGTTTLGFVFSKGIIITVDSRASMGSYVGEESVLVLCYHFVLCLSSDGCVSLVYMCAQTCLGG